MSVYDTGGYIGYKKDYPYVPLIKDGLVLHLDAGDTASYPGSGTTWFDLSGNGNNGTLTNGPTFSSDNGGTLVFDGTNDYVNCGTINLQQNFTLSIWVKINTTANLFGIFGQGITTTNQGLHVIYDSGSRGMIYGMFANDNDYQNNYRPSTGIWYNWVYTYNHSTFAKQFYADTILQTPGASVQNQYAGSGQFNIAAAYSTPSYYANGNIAHALIYNRVLTQAEITQNFNSLRGRFLI